jgi:hypothetical protein
VTFARRTRMKLAGFLLWLAVKVDREMMREFARQLREEK